MKTITIEAEPSRVRIAYLSAHHAGTVVYLNALVRDAIPYDET